MPAAPRMLTAEEIVQVEALASVLSTEQIADYRGIGRTTFYAVMERQPEVLGRYKKGRARAVGSVGQGLIKKAMSGDTASAIFYLKTQGGWQEKPTLKNFEFDYPVNGTPKQRTDALFKAMSDGLIPEEVGTNLINAIKVAIVIEGETELKDRLIVVERAMGLGNG